MNHSARLTSKGQVTLPADIRRSLGLEPGDRVDFVKNEAGRFELRTRKTLADLRGIIKLDRPITSAELDQWIKEARGGAGEVSDDWD